VNPVRAIVLFFLRGAGAGLALAVPALILALLLNPGFPFPGRHALVFWLLVALFYTLLWTVIAAVAALPFRLLARLRRRREAAAAHQKGYQAVLARPPWHRRGLC